MIKINQRYLETEEIRNNSTTRSEVFATQLVDSYISPNNVWNVGAKTNLGLPDIYNDSKNCGFEVVQCEAPIDFLHNDVTKELIKINYDYSKYLSIKNNNPAHVFNKVNLNMTIINNRICSTSTLDLGHSIDWMIENYRKEINKKLNKLNNGNYKSCTNVSLIILNLARANGNLNAQQVRQVYSEEIESNKFALRFNFIYYVTTDGIYLITPNEYQRFELFTDDEYSFNVRKMKQLLKIDEYKNNLQ